MDKRFFLNSVNGTLLAMAKAIAESGRDTPILAVNFGSLGFLTEITRPEIFTALEAVIDGRATHDLRMMLRASTTRRGQADCTHLALNDIVFTRTGGTDGAYTVGYGVAPFGLTGWTLNGSGASGLRKRAPSV